MVSWLLGRNRKMTIYARLVPDKEAVIRRAKRSCLCSSDLPSLAELIDSADDELFNSIIHITSCTLPKETVSSYGLRRRGHNRELLNKSSCLVQSCFLVRMSYKDIYWLFRPTSTNHFSFYNHIIVTLRFVKVLLKFYWLIDWLIDWLLNLILLNHQLRESGLSSM